LTDNSPEIETAEPVAEAQPPAKEDTTSYVFVSVPMDAQPEVRCIVGKEKLVKAVREAYKKCDQQHMYLVKGVLGEMVLGKNKLSVNFGSDETSDIIISLAKRPKLVQNGWIGD